MAEINIPQVEADALIAMEKVRENDTVYKFPNLGGSTIAELVSQDKKEKFLLDIYRGTIKLSKVRYQTRARQTIILVRVDLDGPEHQNPDGTIIPTPHIHLYREGFGTKWAQPLSSFAEFSQPNVIPQMLNDFMRFCHIIQPPNIQF